MKLSEALLYCGSKDQLKEICREADIKSEDMKEQAEKAAAYLLKPSVMEKRLCILHDEDMSFMRKVISAGPLVPVSANYDSADRIRSADYGFVNGKEMALSVPEDAALVFHAIDTKDFNTSRSSYSWIYDCLNLVPYLYGIIDERDFGDMCRRKKDFILTDEEIKNRTDELLKRRCLVHEKDHFFVSNGLEDSGMYERVQEIHAGIKPNYLTYGQMKDLVINRYPSKETSWQKLNKELMHRFKDGEKVRYLLETIWTVMANAGTCSQVNAALKDEMSVDENDPAWKWLLTECWLNTPMMLSMGYKPIEAGLDPARIFLH